MGYETKNFIDNMGSLFLFAFAIASIALVLLVLKPVFFSLKATGAYATIHGVFFFNAMLRYFIESYLEYTISAFVNFKEAKFDGTSGDKIGAVLSIVACIVSVVGPPLAFVFIIKNQANLQGKTF